MPLGALCAVFFWNDCLLFDFHEKNFFFNQFFLIEKSKNI